MIYSIIYCLKENLANLRVVRKNTAKDHEEGHKQFRENVEQHDEVSEAPGTRFGA